MTTTTMKPNCLAEIQDFWDGLGVDHPDLVFAMTQCMAHTASLPRIERDRLLAALLDFEAGTPTNELRALLGAELRALAALPPERALPIVATIDAYQGSASAVASMRRVVALRSACRDLGHDEIVSLERVMPAIRELAGLPPLASVRPSVGGSASSEAPSFRRRGPLARMFSRP